MILFNLNRTIRIADTLNQLDVYTSYNVRSYLPILQLFILLEQEFHMGKKKKCLFIQ